MPETIDATSTTPPGFFIIAAITLAKGVGNKIITNPMEIQLIVNDVELSFTETINDIWNRMEARIEERARDMAIRMVTEAGLEGVADALREVEWKVKDAIHQVNLKD